MKAASQHGLALQHATEEIKGDQKVVLQAVSHWGLSLRFSSEELKGDRQIAEVRGAADMIHERCAS